MPKLYSYEMFSGLQTRYHSFLVLKTYKHKASGFLMTILKVLVTACKKIHLLLWHKDQPTEFEVVQNFSFNKDYQMIKEPTILEEQYQTLLKRWGNDYGSRGPKSEAIFDGEELVLPNGKRW